MSTPEHDEAPSRVALMNYLASQSPELFGHEAVTETIKKYAIEGLQKAGLGDALGNGELMRSIWNEVFGNKK